MHATLSAPVDACMPVECASRTLPSPVPLLTPLCTYRHQVRKDDVAWLRQAHRLGEACRVAHMLRFSAHTPHLQVMNAVPEENRCTCPR
jgi:hypothetical protein